MDDLVTNAVPTAIGAGVGGGGVLWFAKMSFRRMISQYDKKHDSHESSLTKLREAHEADLDKLRDSLADAKTQVAVLLAVIEDTKRVRVDVQGAISKLEGEFNSRLNAALENTDELRADLFVAHERIRLIASGDTDLSKIQKPNIVKRRL